MTTIDEVKARLDIVETISEYVPSLKKSGRSYKALCPFHNERTPSFTVDPQRGSWHCFGACSTGGDVIEFVRRIEGLEFREALQRCADRAGVELRPPTRREQEQREVHERLLRANEAAAMFFRAALGGPDGAETLSYIEGRGLDHETAQTWQLGYAPDGWRALLDHLLARGFTEGELVEAGLAIEGDRGAYDRFRHRLIFPTRDVRGRLIGFGARALRPDDDPKYLNTPQTPLFDKSGTLYGLDRAAEVARRADRMVIVEGYMDVIAAHQFGIQNVVASMGTAITEKQMALVKRYTQNVVLALDADTAGSAATLSGIDAAAGAADRETVATVDWRGLISYQDVLQADIRVASLPLGEDPDTLVRSDPERFRALLDGAKPVTDHLFDTVTATLDPADPRARSRALDALAPAVGAIADPIVRAHYVQLLVRMAQVDERTVLALLRRRSQRRGPEPVPSRTEMRREARRARPADGPDGSDGPDGPDGEAQLLQLLLHRPECREVRDEIDPDTFEDTANRRLFIAWRKLDDLDERADELDDREELDEDVRARLESIRASVPESLSPELLDSRYVGEMATSMAAQLRLRRAQARLAPVAADQAHQVAAARRGDAAAPQSAASDTEMADEIETLATEFVEISERQRELTREYQLVTGRRPADAADDAQESADDTDV